MWKRARAWLPWPHCIQKPVLEPGGGSVHGHGVSQAAMKFKAALRQLVDAALVLWRVLPAILLAWVIAALAVRLLVRDRVPVLSVIFYMTPLIVSAALSGCAALMWLRRRSWLLSGVAGGLAVMSVVWWHASAHANHPVSPADPAGERIVFWTAGRGPR